MTDPPAPIPLGAAHGAYLLIRHRGRPAGRVMVGRSAFGAEIPAGEVWSLATGAGGQLASAYAMADGIAGDRAPAPLPPLTIAVCTRNRADVLRRTLAALVAHRDACGGDVELLVVDNAPSDGSTRAVAEGFGGVRYAVEPVPGLDFGRNRALRETSRPYLGFIDDDALPDHGWLGGFAASLSDRPDAAAFTGPVLPLALGTEAQVRFEAGGGFGRGIAWTHYHRERWGDALYPASAGQLGTGTNMIFRTDTLRALGGFDEALDTGPPLPGGGDLDILYRVVRSGRTIAYSPRQAVFHDHRHDMPGLRRQLRSWGMSIGALARKNARTDPAMALAHWRVIAWLIVNRYGRTIAGYPLGRAPVAPSFALAEFAGLVQGLAGEYDRSLRRVAQRRREHAG